MFIKTTSLVAVLALSLVSAFAAQDAAPAPLPAAVLKHAAVFPTCDDPFIARVIGRAAPGLLTPSIYNFKNIHPGSDSDNHILSDVNEIASLQLRACLQGDTPEPIPPSFVKYQPESNSIYVIADLAHHILINDFLTSIDKPVPNIGFSIYVVDAPPSQSAISLPGSYTPSAEIFDANLEAAAKIAGSIAASPHVCVSAGHAVDVGFKVGESDMKISLSASVVDGGVTLISYDLISQTQNEKSELKNTIVGDRIVINQFPVAHSTKNVYIKAQALK